MIFSAYLVIITGAPTCIRCPHVLVTSINVDTDSCSAGAVDEEELPSCWTTALPGAGCKMPSFVRALALSVNDSARAFRILLLSWDHSFVVWIFVCLCLRDLRIWFFDVAISACA